MSLREIVLDTETTGLDPLEGDRIIEIGCIELINKVKTGVVYHSYINPHGREVSPKAFEVHGISNEFLKDKPLFAEKAKEFLGFIQDSMLIIHNAAFDIKFLNHELGLLNIASLRMDRVQDTLIMARKRYPGSPASLDALCKRFNIDLSRRTKHGALLDAELLAEVYIQLCGGIQARLDFELQLREQYNQEKILTLEKLSVKKKKDSRNYKVSEDELFHHREFISKIKNTIWTTIKDEQN